jgi:hypothetical protein
MKLPFEEKFSSHPKTPVLLEELVCMFDSLPINFDFVVAFARLCCPPTVEFENRVYLLSRFNETNAYSVKLLLNFLIFGFKDELTVNQTSLIDYFGLDEGEFSIHNLNYVAQCIGICWNSYLEKKYNRSFHLEIQYLASNITLTNDSVYISFES